MKKYAVISLICLAFLALILAAGCTKQSEELTGQAVSEPETEPLMSVEPETAVAVEANPTIVEETLPVKEAEEVTGGFLTATEGEIVILGNGGFEPAEWAAKVSEPVVFVNQESTGKDVALVFQLKGSQLSKGSGKIKFGETYAHPFDKAGTYAFWSVGHGVKGTIVVE